MLSVLWVQGPLFVLLLLVASRAWLRQRPFYLPPRFLIALALGLPVLVGLVLPLSDYHFSGHEGAYAELLSGVLPDQADLTSHRTFALPAGLAWGIGKLLPQEIGETLWLLGNRAALALVLLLLADTSYLLHRRFSSGDEQAPTKIEASVAGMLALAAGCLTPPLLGWSATGFAVVPALALGLLCLRLGLAGRPGFVLAFGAFALATRMETAPLVLAGLLLCPPAVWRRSGDGPRLPGLCAGLALFSFEALILSQKSAGLPIEDADRGPSVALENIGNIALGGPVLGALAGAVGLLVILRFVSSGAMRSGRRELTILGVAAAAALVQPLFLVDVGARHLLPAVVLVILLVAPCVSISRLRLRVLWGLWLLVLLVPGLQGLRDLDRRYMTGFEAVPFAWESALAHAPRGTASEILGNSCYSVVPRGSQNREGAADTMDVREVHRAARELSAGRCVLWVVDNDFEFSGDTRAERLDRAVRTLELQPVAWLDPPPQGDRPWVVLRSDPPADH